jgi:hypothetical protein
MPALRAACRGGRGHARGPVPRRHAPGRLNTSRLRRRAAATVILLLAAACQGHASGGPATTTAPSGFSAAALVAPPEIRPGAALVIRGEAAGLVAVDAGHLVWESGPLQSDQFRPYLRERPVGGGRATLLAASPDPMYGLASTPRWVFYARQVGSVRQLVEVHHGGSGRRVLAHVLIAPLAARGDLVAWAEQAGSRQRVVVMDADTQTEWVAADLPRCPGGRCYRIDAVTVTAQGVVFTRGATGTFPAQVVRRGFADDRPTSVAVRDDPQPDLIPDSTGALYYVLSQGWYRWDFGVRAPVLVGGPEAGLETWLRREGNLTFTVSRRGCRYTVSADRPGRSSAPIARPQELIRLTGSSPDSCVQMYALGWTGRQAVTAWAVVPKASESGHSDTGLRGAIMVSSALAAG